MSSRTDSHAEYFRSLSRAEVQLLALRGILYDGSWEEMVLDLEARKAGKPYVFKLQNRIEEDLQRIQGLIEYEAKNSVNLGKYLAQDSLPGERRAV